MHALARIREEAAGAAIRPRGRRRDPHSGKAVLFVSSAVAAGYSTLC
jgi:hypothetical protein